MLKGENKAGEEIKGQTTASQGHGTQGNDAIKLVLLKDALAAGEWMEEVGDQRGEKETRERRRQGKLGSGGEGDGRLEKFRSWNLLMGCSR